MAKNNPEFQPCEQNEAAVAFVRARAAELGWSEAKTFFNAEALAVVLMKERPETENEFKADSAVFVASAIKVTIENLEAENVADTDLRRIQNLADQLCHAIERASSGPGR